ncbi:hypothetical protein MLD38_001593 [Melastoma candidum]|uniref:Uncharacterized protein n=1 Tax=Melastoma candidum TaxID=119954 RepID=A0ACB9SH19_9MYRT|nr:hypothetical protein MLD38_001593 [Melastoma candidum]
MQCSHQCARASLRRRRNPTVLCRLYSSFSIAQSAGDPSAHHLLANPSAVSTRDHLLRALTQLFATNDATADSQTYAALFHLCARHQCPGQGLALHRHLLCKTAGEVPDDVFLNNHIVNMYAKCGYMDRAHKLFDEMRCRNHVTWSVLISGYAQWGRGEECFELFADMLVENAANEFVVVSVLSSCRSSDRSRGEQVHALTLKVAIDSSVYVGNSLISMYSKSRAGGFGEVHRNEARRVFDSMEYRNSITWNSMIAGVQFGDMEGEAVYLFIKMRQSGIEFDRTTIVAVISAVCASAGQDATGGPGLECCRQFHCLAIKSSFILEVEVATALMKAYSDIRGEVADCYKLFKEHGSRGDVIFWTSMIKALSDHDPEESFTLFRGLLREGMRPDRYTFSSILKACAGLVSEKHALMVHSMVAKSGLDHDTALSNALIHAYARCGCLALSEHVFDLMGSYDLVSWNSMLKAYALHGRGKEALNLFSQMKVLPDSATFVALLSACSHTGLVEDGIGLFKSMSEKYGIHPQLDHYACMVDILGRAGRVGDAWELIEGMPMQPDSIVWSALLASCRKHGIKELADMAAGKLRELHPDRSLGYVQISNMHCLGGRFDDAVLIRKEMEGARVRKEPGLSWVQVGKQIHEFASGGRWHPHIKKIYAELDSFIRKLKELGYVPETRLALHDLEEEHREEELYYHSEKLALVFAVMNGGRTNDTIKIIKNIRICVDCHNFMKLSSELLQKEIVLRDSNRFHHFCAKVCSCDDYW